MSQRLTLTPIVLVLTAATVLNAPLCAQVSGDSRPPADPADVESVDAIMSAVYDVISGPAGQQRDWDRMRSLFIPGARLIPTGRDSAGASVHRVLTLDQWIAGADRAFSQAVSSSENSIVSPSDTGISCIYSARTIPNALSMGSRSREGSTAFNSCTTATGGES